MTSTPENPSAQTPEDDLIAEDNLPEVEIVDLDDEEAPVEKVKKPKRPQQVYTLLIEVGRKAGDGLPKGATGAGLVIYASGVDEAEAVRESVLILKQADLAPLDVTGYGTLQERLDQGHEVPEEERELMARALAENSVIVAQMVPFFGEDRPEPFVH